MFECFLINNLFTKMFKKYFEVKVIILVSILCSTNGFNLSPKPNYVFKEPNSMPNSRSSYFGYAMNLRKSSVVVGAPRAQSTLKTQNKLIEPGAVYKCFIKNGTCDPLVFETTNKKNYWDQCSLSQHKIKDHQWLGASMDGGPLDSDKLVVCAPRFMASDLNEYYMHGICYWMPNTLSNDPLKVKKIEPLTLRADQVLGNEYNRYVYYSYGEQGVSVHFTNNSQDVIIGAPGIFNWKGSIIRHHLQTDVNTKKESPKDVTDCPLKTLYENNTVIPNPGLWNNESSSYFGYSVDSGYFDSTRKDKIYYVASAPRARKHNGEVYIFDIIKTSTNYSIKTFKVFQGTQLGEFFGYAVLAEDLNNDNLTDLIVSAPQHSSDKVVEQGAIYVFINRGRFNFELKKIIKSPFEGRGRFGTSISRLGDIDRDRYNDIAVGAPFAGNGTVFIYRGSLTGLHEESSQQLSPGPIATWGTSAMFGHGLSKGSDIDNNGFNDFAIGAPNAESVFVYRSYPVVKIHAKIRIKSREIKPDQKKLKLEICYKISTQSRKIQSQNINMTLNVDPKLERVKLENNSSKQVFVAKANLESNCLPIEANVKFILAKIFKPIEFKLNFKLLNTIPNSEKFCEDCAVVNPSKPKSVSVKLPFANECKAVICISDLKIKSLLTSSKYIRGSSKTISITYVVENSGETAYLPQINITSSNNMAFYKIPPRCSQNNDYVLCDLSEGTKMAKNGKANITIVYQTQSIGYKDKLINLTASVNGTGEDRNLSDNFLSDLIHIQEFTNIDVIGIANTTDIDLEKHFNTTEVVYKFEVKSNGPSAIEELQVEIKIPTSFKSHDSNQSIPIIDIKSINVEASYNDQVLFVQLANASIFEEEFNVGENVRRKRSSNNENSTSENTNIKGTTPSNGTSPINRKIVFSCLRPESHDCVTAVINITNFLANTSVPITLKYSVDLNEINKILKKPLEFFEIAPQVIITKIDDLNGSTVNITTKMNYHEIFKPHFNIYKLTPWWMIALAVLCGTLVLTSLVYGMHKAGFFKRTTMEEMQRIVKEEQEAAEWRKALSEELNLKLE